MARNPTVIVKDAIFLAGAVAILAVMRPDEDAADRRLISARVVLGCPERA